MLLLFVSLFLEMFLPSILEEGYLQIAISVINYIVLSGLFAWILVDAFLIPRIVGELNGAPAT
jgi:hypothetical protein